MKRQKFWRAWDGRALEMLYGQITLDRYSMTRYRVRECETGLNIRRLCGVPLTRFRLDLATGDGKSSMSAIKRSNKHLFILEASLTRLANFRYSRPREWSLLSRQQRATLLRR